MQYQNTGDIININIYIDNRFTIANSSSSFFSMDKISKSIWFRELLNKKMSSNWISSSDFGGDTSFEGSFAYEPEKLLSYVKKVFSSSNFNETVGAIRFDFEKSKIISILSNSRSTNNSQTYLMNLDGKVIAVSDDVDTLLLTPNQILASGINISSASSIWNKIPSGNKSFFVGARKLSICDWYMITIVPLNVITSKSNITGVNFLIMAIIIILVSFIFIYFITFSIASRISTVVHAMNSGQLQQISASNKNDEIDVLMNGYNYMVNNVCMLMKKQEESQVAIKNAEFIALQSQINPHFLYNTLEMINWFVWSENKDDAIKIVSALSEFYKMSLNKGMDVFYIQDELHLLSAYCQIQGMRYRDNIKFIFEIPKEILQFQMPKIILQPIVENSISHGILCKSDKTGTIKISAKLISQDILFTISDDGVGIPIEILAKINNGELVTTGTTTGTGYGVKSVNERLKLSYGEDYGFHFESKIGVGTIVTVKIPIISDQPFLVY